MGALAAALLIGTASPAGAGGGPQNVLLVVNALSDGSKRVANEYVQLRDLPPANVLYLDYRGPRESASADVFRQQILAPVFAAIARRGLAPQIDVIAYSTDFPWRIAINKDFPDAAEKWPFYKPFASLTGATYLSGFVIRKHPGMLGLNTNWYVPQADGPASQVTNLTACKNIGAVASRAFHARRAWLPGGEAAPEGTPGRRYLMATMLGVTTGRGNTVEEVIAALRRAVEADIEPPQGSVYYMQNGDVRSKRRHACYREAANQLRQMGQPSEVRGGVLPPSGRPIAGLMTGANTFDVPAAKLDIRPGAICEHLTSNGGMLLDMPWATPLSEWIRAGATATCGTVVEPYAVQAKFPLPTLQLHYRRGCSMAEAFYQSVAAPYQLLVVGDPLCQPWAQRPALAVDGVPQSASEVDLNALSLRLLRGEAPKTPEPDATPATGSTLRMTPTVSGLEDGAPGVWEAFVDGRLVGQGASGEPTQIDLTQLAPGWRALRVVGIAPDLIAAQRVWAGSVRVGADGRTLAAADETPVTLNIEGSNVPFDGQLQVTASAAEATKIEIRQNHRVVAFVDGAAGSTTIDPAVLGRGPVRLQAKALPSRAASAPVWLTIE